MIVKNIPVDSIQIDMPISEDNVVQKMESFKANGIIQPITVWKHKGELRVIDGFHRLEAAKRLGWTHLAATVVECTEEAFWDARIQSARQHSDISEARLIQWVSECWQASKAGKTTDEALADLAKTLWNSGLKRFGYGGEKELTPTQNAVYKWIADKAKRWGVDWDVLTQMIVGRFIKRDSILDEAARRMEYDLDQRAKLDPLHYVSGYQREFDPAGKVVEYAESGNELTSDGFLRNLRDKDKEANQLIWAEERRKQDKEGAAHAEDLAKENEWLHNTEAGNKKAAQELVSTIENVQGQVSYLLEQREWILRKMPDGPAQVARIAQVAGDFITRVWPSTDADHWQTPEVLQQNIELRQLLDKEHDQRIQAEAALLTGQKRHEKLRERLPDAIAWPGE